MRGNKKVLFGISKTKTIFNMLDHPLLIVGFLLVVVACVLLMSVVVSLQFPEKEGE